MSTPTWQWMPSRGAYVQAQGQDRARQDQQYENSARSAFQTISYDTTGVGQIVVPAPQRFDTTFVEPPVVTSGSVLIKPAHSYWAYPQATAGVYRWLTDTNGYINGAYLFFNVTVLPAHPDDLAADRRESLDDSLEILGYQNALTQMATSTASVNQVRASLKRPKAAFERQQRLKDAGPPAPVITHHLLFQGVAMKELPASVTGELQW